MELKTKWVLKHVETPFVALQFARVDNPLQHGKLLAPQFFEELRMKIVIHIRVPEIQGAHKQPRAIHTIVIAAMRPFIAGYNPWTQDAIPLSFRMVVQPSNRTG